MTSPDEAHTLAMVGPDGLDRPRLLPWTTPDGKPCYLSADGTSRLSRLADDVEAAQLRSGAQVLAGARAVLDDTKAGEHAVRFALTRAAESLRDVLRIAVSRGHRIGTHDGAIDADNEPIDAGRCG